MYDSIGNAFFPFLEIYDCSMINHTNKTQNKEQIFLWLLFYDSVNDSTFNYVN